MTKEQFNSMTDAEKNSYISRKTPEIQDTFRLISDTCNAAKRSKDWDDYNKFMLIAYKHLNEIKVILETREVI